MNFLHSSLPHRQGRVDFLSYTLGWRDQLTKDNFAMKSGWMHSDPSQEQRMGFSKTVALMVALACGSSALQAADQKTPATAPQKTPASKAADSKATTASPATKAAAATKAVAPAKKSPEKPVAAPKPTTAKPVPSTKAPVKPTAKTATPAKATPPKAAPAKPVTTTPAATKTAPAKPAPTKPVVKTPAPAKPAPTKPVPSTPAPKVADEPELVGLRGILVEEVPDDLIDERINVFGKSWSKWSEETAADVMKLYDPETNDLAAQRAAIAKLRDRLKTIETAVGDRAYSAIHSPLRGLYSRLKRRVDVAEAILDTLEVDPQVYQDEQIAQAAKALQSAIATVEADLGSFRSGDRWVTYLGMSDLKKAVQGKKWKDAAIASTLNHLNVAAQSSNKAVSDFGKRASFVSLRKALSGLTSATSATAKRANPRELRAELTKIAAALEVAESQNLSAPGPVVMNAVARIRKLGAAEADRISSTLAVHYFNYNLRVTASERFLAKVAGERRVEQGVVQDFILGANVYGNQTTTVSSTIDLKPSENGVKLNIAVNGIVQSNTSGSTDQATVYTSGYHQFWANKPVFYNGEKFQTSPATISVAANNNTYAASTGFDGIPILGGIGRRIAMGEAEKRRGESEAIARQKIASRVLPELDSSADKEFAKANKDSQETWIKGLKSNRLFPTQQRLKSTDHYMLLYSRVGTDNEFGGSSLLFAPPNGKDLTIRIHESTLNNALSRMNFAGREMNDEEIGKEIERSLSSFFGRKIDFKNDPNKQKSNDKFVFDSKDPIRVKIEDGEIILVLRTGLKPADGEEIPTQVITVPMNYKVQKDVIAITRGQVIVAPKDRPDNPARQIIRAGIIRKKIEDSLGDRTRTRKMNIDRKGKTPVEIVIDRIAAVDGWVTVWAK